MNIELESAPTIIGSRGAEERAGGSQYIPAGRPGRCQALFMKQEGPAPRRCTNSAVARVRGTHRLTADLCTRHSRIAVDRPRLVAEWLARCTKDPGGAGRARTMSRPQVEERLLDTAHDLMHVSANLASVALVRSEAARILFRRGFGEETLSRVLLAVTEAVGNAIEHGSPEAGEVIVGVSVSRDRAVVFVFDEGRLGAAMPLTSPSAPPAREPRGRGRLVMAALADEIQVTSDGDGTRVALEFVLPEIPLHPDGHVESLVVGTVEGEPAPGRPGDVPEADLRAG